jgi:hypothetical protein
MVIRMWIFLGRRVHTLQEGQPAPACESGRHRRPGASARDNQALRWSSTLGWNLLVVLPPRRRLEITTSHDSICRDPKRSPSILHML